MSGAIHNAPPSFQVPQSASGGSAEPGGQLYLSQPAGGRSLLSRQLEDLLKDLAAAGGPQAQQRQEAPPVDLWGANTADDGVGGGGQQVVEVRGHGDAQDVG